VQRASRYRANLALNTRNQVSTFVPLTGQPTALLTPQVMAVRKPLVQPIKGLVRAECHCAFSHDSSGAHQTIELRFCLPWAKPFERKRSTYGIGRDPDFDRGGNDGVCVETVPI